MICAGSSFEFNYMWPALLLCGCSPLAWALHDVSDEPEAPASHAIIFQRSSEC